MLASVQNVMCAPQLHSLASPSWVEWLNIDLFAAHAFFSVHMSQFFSESDAPDVGINSVSWPEGLSPAWLGVVGVRRCWCG